MAIYDSDGCHYRGSGRAPHSRGARRDRLFVGHELTAETRILLEQGVMTFDDRSGRRATGQAGSRGSPAPGSAGSTRSPARSRFRFRCTRAKTPDLAGDPVCALRDVTWSGKANRSASGSGSCLLLQFCYVQHVARQVDVLALVESRSAGRDRRSGRAGIRPPWRSARRPARRARARPSPSDAATAGRSRTEAGLY